jgi:hypothetical protein
MNTHESNSAARHLSPARHGLVLLLAAATLAGCARRYDMILTNGGELTNVRKPTRDEKGGFYTYVDGRGQTNLVSIARVVEIHPHQKATFTSPQ